MADKFDHTVLIVDDEEQIGRALGRLMKSIGAKYVYMESGIEALDRIKTADKPFSLILSDQRMPQMEGSVFLEKAKEIAPDTIRFLITGYADVDAVTDAVNKGSIHRYIAKPWDNRVLAETVKAGLEQHELIMENHRLFALAKEQNTKLYTLNTDLKKSAAVHKKAIIQKDKQILELNKRLERGFENRNYINEIEALLKEKQLLDQGKLNSLYVAIIAELYEQFQDIATRNGFEMPESIPGG
ncbi:MAG: response regulator [Proteobacteria bacterium]|nr:response regulator [Pseudomonadota bacterium]MBU1585631.1 response regulator [Pseudomonadota bacterium]MBU2627061.1 response regulator [Pseudomonadota bacterium]